MRKERTFTQRGKEMSVSEIPHVFAVHPSSAAASQTNKPGGPAGTPVGDTSPMDAQTLDREVDPSQVQAFQKAGWQFVRSPPGSGEPPNSAKLLVTPDGRLVLGINRLTVKLSDSLPEAEAEAYFRERHLRILNRLKFVPNLFEVEIEPAAGGDSLDVAARLSSEPVVDFAEPQFLEELSSRQGQRQS